MPELQLSWQPGFSLSRKPVKRPTARRKRQQQFEFVVENPQKTYHTRRSLIVTTNSKLPSLPWREHCNLTDTHSSQLHRAATSENGPPIDLSDGTTSTRQSIIGETFHDLETTNGTTESHLNHCSSEDQIISSHSPELATSERNGAGPDPNTAGDWVLTYNKSLLSTSLSPAIEYSSLTERFKPMLNRYNEEFCKIPLTFDLRINPFRYRTDIDPEPNYLVHAVMALAGHHVQSTTALSHRQTALQLFRQSLDTFGDAEIMYSMLDTIIILFSLDETQSMLGNWNTHLLGAYNLLEFCGGIKALSMSSRVEAQIGILTWWDAVTSLLAREDCVFPYDYFDAILSSQHKREWDFFGLCGCPTSLAEIVMQVARLSAQKQEGNSTPDLQFSSTLISGIEQSLESWRHVPAATAFRDEESMHQDQDVMHCSEAWRHGLLLYIFRVFEWELGNPVPIHILHGARLVVEHVISCRDINMIGRQALLPLFLAGCELRDRSIRRQIVKLCAFWDEKTRYHMFRGTIPLLENVWAEQEIKGFENVWWGQVVDEQHLADAHPLKMRLCFG